VYENPRQQQALLHKLELLMECKRTLVKQQALLYKLELAMECKSTHLTTGSYIILS
jgi:hypothetical protein